MRFGLSVHTKFFVAYALFASGFTALGQTNDAPHSIDTPTMVQSDSDFEGRLINEPKWVLQRPNYKSVDYRGSAARDYTAETQKIELLGLGNQKLSLICQTNIYRGRYVTEAVLSAAIDLDRKTTANIPVDQRAVADLVEGKLIISGQASRVKFALEPTRINIVPLDRTTPKKLFNASVRGDKVTIHFDDIPNFEAKLPKINEDFRNFVKVCPAVQPKKM